ncbi:5,6-dimethylbenzimidazole synthase [Roseobacter sp.]|uniref:5,6-dimethylbenzimidazole synthase n=1 Tax=Roseobacter sp. TaxID=1907202 RepID=UPI0032969F4B
MLMDATHRRALDDLLQWRRDVRHFCTDPIAPDVLAQLRARMNRAPSVGNARPWRVVQVEAPALRAQIIASFETCNADAALAYDAAAQREYLALKLAGLRDAPVHLAVFTDVAVAEGRGLGRQTMPETLAYSTVMAIHTLWLAARAHNIGLGWVSIIDPQAVTAILDVPDTWSLAGYLCLGYPALSSDTPLLHETGWQENTDQPWVVK